jgi:nicotinamidase-related amidase
MTDSIPNFGRLAVFVIDVQKYLISGPDAVPDALEIRQAISNTLESVRQHNDLVELEPHESARKTRIIFVQHDDKDPHDPLHKGKPTWELEFSPRKDDDTEVFVSKDVRTSPLAKHNGVHYSLSKLIKTRQRVRK